jgi:pimeloyl-ACP methyl ester carboxylesterase
MPNFRSVLCVALTAALLTACGSSTQTGAVNSSTAQGSLAINPPFRIASLDAATFAGELGATTTGAQLLALTGAPVCGVDFYYLLYWTIGGAGETTESSGALMVPTGASPGCTGPRPIVEYAHGTQTDKAANIADITNPSNTEGALIAAAFAAKGFIVVAPNFAGYDISTLGYYPFINAAQNSSEMIDMLTAARTALPNTLSAATSDNGKLFVTGYSAGGYVAMATQRALQLAGKTVTAAAPMSGPYAMEAFADAIFAGDVDLGSTVFSPLLTTSYQKSTGGLIYSATTDIYSPTYATGIETLLPSTTPIDTIFAEGLLPSTFLFDITTPVVTVPGDAALSAELTAVLAYPSNKANPDTPLFDLGFGNPYLINNSYRVEYIEDAAENPDGAVPTLQAGAPLAAHEPMQILRKTIYQNDLRNGGWAPASPTLLCGGDQDPTVFFSVNTLTMQAFWSALPAGLVTVLDLDGTPSGAFAEIQGGFQASQAALLAYYESAAGGSQSAADAENLIVQNYHTNVAPFCVVAASSFFGNF